MTSCMGMKRGQVPENSKLLPGIEHGEVRQHLLVFQTSRILQDHPALALLLVVEARG